MTYKARGITSDDGSAPGKTKELLVVALAVVLALTAYGGTLNHELVWDDLGIVGYIDSIVKEGGLPALVSSQFATHIEKGYVSGYYRPVTLTSLWLDSSLSGTFPWIYHLTNILLNAVNTLLVYVLLRLLGGRFSAAVGAMIFAVHPIHTESVSFISGRTDLWAAFFVLLSVFPWIRERKGLSPAPTRDRLLSCAAFFMACLSKEVAVMLPAVLLVWEWSTPDLKQPGHLGWWYRNRPWILGWAVVLTAVVLLRYEVFGTDLGLIQSRAGPDVPAAGALSFPMTGQMMLIYLRLLVLPWPLKVYYGPAQLHLNAAVITGACLFLALHLYTFTRCRKDSVFQGLAWIVLFTLPVLFVGTRGGALLAERFLYLPSVGISLLAGTLAAGLAVDRRAVAAVTGILVALMMAGSMKQNAVWRNEVTLFEELVRIAPNAPGGHYNLGNAYAAKGRQSDAVRSYRRVLDMDRDDYRALFNMGNSLGALGSHREAVQAYRQALGIYPDLVPAYINLGAALMELGEHSESAAIFREGIQRSPDDSRLHLGLTLALLGGGQRQSALDHLKALEKKDPAVADLIRSALLEGEFGVNGVDVR